MKYAIVLAAGRGTRMRTGKNKVMHELLHKPTIGHLVSNLEKIKIDQTVVVTGYDSESVEAYLKDRVSYAYQDEQIGTGDAVSKVTQLADKKGSTLLVFGDTGLLQPEMIQTIFDKHEGHDLTITTAISKEPGSESRVIRDNQGMVSKVVNHRDLSDVELKSVNEVNLGVYCFDNELLFEYLPKIEATGPRMDLNIIDLVRIMREDGRQVQALRVSDSKQFTAIADRHRMASAQRWLQDKINEGHMDKGVTILDPNTTFIGPDVKIQEDTTIYPNNHIYGVTSIKNNVTIYPGCWIEDGVIGENTEIHSSKISQSRVGKNSTVGPNAHLRLNSKVGQNVRIGNYVELKNSSVASGSSCAHLTYLGDAEIGKNVNIGCGVVTANYDGSKKHKTIIGDNVFVGSNSSLIAPLKIGANAKIAAGSTIVDDVGSYDLAIARTRQEVKKEYVKKKKEKEV
ncbi:bifunctional UDP-N-acetylglucosamine diphosphorylase/glucosamine-1-phosphate N-acetyltransferase GlmU [Erysipelothrix urinaevulpis]|uniref:bifunctional UDP-N-acetylglucosamine diphosphorylase/glucosamine-1-phosphate N-acetyltransferase GlmU n=1 Tax=Erysipelothrix urinaevulpis TaxID=2683717 RepID=UPI001357608A|nr:bifunctional UDP-N-acetylglucosamine diphosphorylase/glucosamine-1-phosphate N-acetyltransferase GlmU [Erysipelothrix urinaevulpis]